MHDRTILFWHLHLLTHCKKASNKIITPSATNAKNWSIDFKIILMLSSFPNVTVVYIATKQVLRQKMATTSINYG